jgi:hypothetical protein
VKARQPGVRFRRWGSPAASNKQRDRRTGGQEKNSCCVPLASCFHERRTTKHRTTDEANPEPRTPSPEIERPTELPSYRATELPNPHLTSTHLHASILTSPFDLSYAAGCLRVLQTLIQSGRGNRPVDATATWQPFERTCQGATSCPRPGRDKSLGRPIRSLKYLAPTTSGRRVRNEWTIRARGSQRSSIVAVLPRRAS